MEGMFTGIVEEIGTVKGIKKDSLSIQAGTVLGSTKIGDSIAVNGACLTVIFIDKVSFAVEIMPETRKLTNIGAMKVGDKVNLERAVSVQGRFGGHFVQGHIDATGKVDSISPEAEALIATISALPDVLKYIVKKGFIAVNGVSLTVIDNNSQHFSVSLVTHTRKNTNLGMLKQGDTVNLEVDIIAKYIEKFYHPNKQEGIISLLNKYDYLKAR
jgi:riboflavin synthase